MATDTRETLVEARDLARHYRISRGWLKPHAVLRALDGVSFTLTAGRTLAVVGESGCGKTTLARLVAMIDLPTGGALQLAGIDPARAGRHELKRIRPLVQMVFQNPYASLNPRKKVAAMLEEPLVVNTRLGKAERKERCLAMMAKVGLQPEHYARCPHMFSGGQRQRIAIARALMPAPQVIVADEPVSALDVSIQAQVLNLLMDLQDGSGIAYLFISHNLAVVEHIADEVLVMYLGKTVEHGSKQQIFRQPLHPYSKALLASMPRVDANRRQQKIILPGELPSPLAPPAGCAFSNRCPHARERCHLETPPLERFEDRWVACLRVGEIA